MLLGSSESATGGTDRIVLKDLTLADLTFATYDYGDGAGAGAHGNTLRLLWNDGTSSGELRLAQLGSYIERFEFADGTTLSAISYNAANGYTTLTGTAGNDRIAGTNGADILSGGLGIDTMLGGLGNDIYIVDQVGDTASEAASAGTDSVYAAIAWTLGANTEVLALTGANAIAGTGNAVANTMSGNSGNNLLNGAAGDDWLSGGLGGDTLVGGAGSDTFHFAAIAEFGDTVTDYSGVAGNDDRLQFSAVGLGGGLVAGSLDATSFQSRADNLAQDANDRFIFRTTDQTLWYDANGNAAGGPTMVADLQTGAILSAADILLY